LELATSESAIGLRTGLSFQRPLFANLSIFGDLFSLCDGCHGPHGRQLHGRVQVLAGVDLDLGAGALASGWKNKLLSAFMFLSPSLPGSTHL
jgi:hypothetical protein